MSATATAGVKAVKADHVDLVILDVNLPDMDGREACKIMRRNGYKGPIIMLTAQGSDSDTILGLDSGANDYVTKPFRFGVLLARIRAHLRQHEQSEDAIFKVGPYTFKPASKMLMRDDNKKIRLTEKETAIIKFLYRSGEQIVSRDVLLARCLGLQCRCYHPYAGNPYLPAAPKDRARSGPCRNPGHRGRRL